MSEATVFGPGYAGFYDHFYADKDYDAECDFLEEVFHRYASRPVRTILDMGCGTGGHALRLAQRGYQVTGVDRAEAMLATARSKTAASRDISLPDFLQGDIRTIHTGETYDTVIAMFAVMGYMTTNEDLAAALQNAHRHLQPGGLLIFDAWFGPGVLAQRPVDRYKIVSDKSKRVIRFVHADLDALRHVVSVTYKILEIEPGLPVREVDEVHLMRYLFPQEITFHLTQTGFYPVWLMPCWEFDATLREDHWNMVVVACASEENAGGCH